MALGNAAQRTAHARETSLARARGTSPALSVILVSQGARHELERAVRVVAPTLRAMKAQLIVVRRNPESTLEFVLSEAGRVDIVRASDDSTRRDMLATAMRLADGDLIALREDTAVCDVEWLSAYRRLLIRESPPEEPITAIPALEGATEGPLGERTGSVSFSPLALRGLGDDASLARGDSARDSSA
jgi:hypothetical protein